MAAPLSPPGFATAPSGRRIPALTGRQKAAILVRLLLSEGVDIDIAALPEAMQAELTAQMAEMRLVDRDTMMAVVAELVETLEQVGLSFPEGIEGALRVLGDRLSPGAAGRLRQIARASGRADPWERIATAEPALLAELLARESTEVAAVVISKLPVARAAELLGFLPGDQARRVALAVACTEGIAPVMVTRIGMALAGELDLRPPPVFPTPPAARVGAILNSASAELRDRLLEEIGEDDSGFADGIRRAIFTFSHIHSRLAPLDVPRVLREVDQPVLITALAATLQMEGTDQGRSAEFLLANVSQRMATNLRDEIEGRGRIRPSEAERAMGEVVAALRGLVEGGEITLVETEDEA